MRIGFAGLVHGHVWGLIDRFAEVPDVQLAAVADETPLLANAQDRFGQAYGNWQEMLDREELDGVVVTTDNLEGANVAVEALGRGMHVFVEKPMAANAQDAKRMLGAWEDAGTTLMVNWPFAWQPSLMEFARRLQEEAMGPIFHLRYRNGHHGPREIGCDSYFTGWLYDEAKNGGGAIADFGGYGAVLCRWLLGMPETVIAVRGNFTKDYEVPDDHAICLLKYPRGSASIEGTWATFGFDESANPVAHAKRGTLAVYGSELKRHTANEGTTLIEVPELPQGNPAAYFVDCARTGKTPEGMLDPRISADACRIIDAAKASCRSGCESKL